MATAKKRAPRKKTTVKRVAVNIGKRKKRRSSVGSTTHRRHTTKAKTKRRKSRKHGILGATTGGSHMSRIKQIGKLAIGVAGGAIITHVAIRPLELKLLEKFPMAAKWLSAGEIIVGGMIAIKAKHEMVRGAGIGILASGVHGAIKQLDIYKHIPGIHGPDEYQTIQVPMTSGLRKQMAGLINDGRRDVYTNQVAGMEYTSKIAGSVNNGNNSTYTNRVAGEWDEVWDMPNAKA